MALRRLVQVVGTALAWLLLTAAPAAAHSVGGVTATNYRSRITSITPALPGLEVRVVELGSRLELSNRTGQEVVVLGYQGEPYLRVGPEGVFENLRSEATYVNRTRTGNVTVPPEAETAQPETPPRWRQVSDGQTARWHDHRIHWMSGRPPPQVERAPGRVHQVGTWTVLLEKGTTPVTVRGELTWVPGPSPLPWVVLALILVALSIAASVSRRWAPLLAICVAVLLVVDVVHALGIAFATAGPLLAQLARVVTGSFFSVVGWAAGLWGILALVRNRADGLFGVLFAALVVALYGGLSDLSVLGSSQVPFAWGATLARFTVASSLGLGLGVLAGGGIALRRANQPSSLSEPVAP